jgi:hypothetical protein
MVSEALPAWATYRKQVEWDLTFTLFLDCNTATVLGQRIHEQHHVGPVRHIPECLSCSTGITTMKLVRALGWNGGHVLRACQWGSRGAAFEDFRGWVGVTFGDD